MQQLEYKGEINYDHSLCMLFEIPQPMSSHLYSQDTFLQFFLDTP